MVDERTPEEERARRAFEDYHALGPTRSLVTLWQRYQQALEYCAKVRFRPEIALTRLQ